MFDGKLLSVSECGIIIGDKNCVHTVESKLRCDKCSEFKILMEQGNFVEEQSSHDITKQLVSSLHEACIHMNHDRIGKIAGCLRYWDQDIYSDFNLAVPTNDQMAYWNSCDGIDLTGVDPLDPEKYQWATNCSGVFKNMRILRVNRCATCQEKMTHEKRKRVDSKMMTPGKSRLKAIARLDPSSHINHKFLSKLELTERLTSLKAKSKQVEKEVTQMKSKVEIIELENDKMDQKMKDLMKEMSMDGEKMKHAWNKVISESISKLVFTQKMSQGDLTNLQDKVKEKSETLYGVLIQQFEVMARQEFATENGTPGIKNGMK